MSPVTVAFFLLACIVIFFPCSPLASSKSDGVRGPARPPYLRVERRGAGAPSRRNVAALGGTRTPEPARHERRGARRPRYSAGGARPAPSAAAGAQRSTGPGPKLGRARWPSSALLAAFSRKHISTSNSGSGTLTPVAPLFGVCTGSSTVVPSVVQTSMPAAPSWNGVCSSYKILQKSRWSFLREQRENKSPT
ncbi:unnamed protein product [Urochloa humidicola]